MSVFRAFKLLGMLKNLIKNDYASASTSMSELHGLPQKFGQHLTLYQGSHLNSYFEKLCVESKTEALPAADYLKSINISFQEINLYAQASIGQVYKVKSRDKDLALKIKYPNIEKKIKSDIKTLKLILAPLKLTPLKNNNLFLLAEYFEQLLINECDYLQEAYVQNTFCKLFKEDSDIVVPFAGYFDEKAILSEWVEGNNLLNKDEIDDWFVNNLLRFLLISLKEIGMVHSDPNPGNFLIFENNGTKQLAVLDYGSVVILNVEQKELLVKLILGNLNSEQDLFNALGKLGVSGETIDDYRPILGDLISILFEPFYYPGHYNFADWRLQYKINTLMSSRQWARPLAISPSLIMILRAMQGVYHYARSSSVKINWYNAARNYLR